MQRQSIRKFLNNKYLAYIIAGIFLVLSILLGISIGTVSVPILTIIQIIGAKIFGGISLGSIDPMYSSIVLNIRLPRVILSGLVGASLAIAGAAFQGLLRNPVSRSIYIRCIIRSISRCGSHIVFSIFPFLL